MRSARRNWPCSSRRRATMLPGCSATCCRTAALQRAIELRPDYSLNHSTLGFVLSRAGRYKQAVEAYRRATNLEPSAANFQRLGTALHLSGNVQEAIGNYQHAVQLAHDPLAYSNLAFSYYSAGRYAEALAAWQESASLSKTPT